ncbi:MAG: hypothetical protein N2C14_01270, partial [Planctomycetales bacterium]
MLGTQLAMQMKYGPQSMRMRAYAAGAVGILILAWLVRNPSLPSQAVAVVAWTQFLMAVIVGGSLTGWRVTQLPKSRTAEFFLMTPRTDWEIVRIEIVGGMLRTAYVIGANVPFILAMWGGGWITPVEATALIVVPVAAGWTAGLVLAAVAYAPLWVRRFGERMVLVCILVYLVLFGLLTELFVLNFVSYAAQWTQNYRMWVDPAAMADFINPFRLLGVVGQHSDAQVSGRLAATLAVLFGVCLTSYWWLGWRLRRHYLEENYGSQYRRKGYVKPILENPLAWWTARRVSRFRGNVNLYLGGTTVVLYCGWMLVTEYAAQLSKLLTPVYLTWIAFLFSSGTADFTVRLAEFTTEAASLPLEIGWPAWAGGQLMKMFWFLGGSAVLGVFGVQFGLVPVGFLSGLWDSNQQQRVGRLELLLVTELTARDFLGGSVAAAWTRGKWYLVGVLFLW